MGFCFRGDASTTLPLHFCSLFYWISKYDLNTDTALQYCLVCASLMFSANSNVFPQLTDLLEAYTARLAYKRALIQMNQIDVAHNTILESERFAAMRTCKRPLVEMHRFLMFEHVSCSKGLVSASLK